MNSQEFFQFFDGEVEEAQGLGRFLGLFLGFLDSNGLSGLPVVCVLVRRFVGLGFA